MTMTDIIMSPERWQDRWEFFKNEPQQVSGIWLLYEAIKQSDPSLLSESAEWAVKFSEQPPAPPPSAKLTPSAPFTQKVTPNFVYGELTLNDPARRFINQGQCDIATELCEFLEKARAQFGPIKITSGHRPPAVNAAVGGASNSEHLFQAGCGAVDCYPANGRGKEFENWVDQQWPFSVGYGMDYRGFVHIGIRSGRPRVRWDY